MHKLIEGEYFGKHKQESSFSGFLITDTEYTHEKVDWHYHENPYFTFLLQGKLFEANKKESYYLKPGSLLFHNWQEAHYNIKPPEYTRGFHIELNNKWFSNHINLAKNVEGSICINDPLIKQEFNKILLESKIKDKFSETSIELSILNTFCSLKKESVIKEKSVPKWIAELKSILHEEAELCTSLTNLSSILGIHPVHLSRQFPKYFNSSLGTYLRNQKINKSIELIVEKKLSMTEIAYECGFFDQSHFTSNFKNVFGITPLNYQKTLKC